jgi:putative ABC transport system substrate-binding protein
LVALAPHVIVTVGSETTAAVQAKTNTVPIVMIGPGDPVGAGFVASLARPGGNITGVSSQLNDINGKKLQIVREFLPGGKHVAFFFRSDNRSESLARQPLVSAAKALGLIAEAVPVTTNSELDAALSALARARPDALLLSAQPPATLRTRDIAAFAVAHHIITIAPYPPMVRAGLLLSLGPNGDEMIRRAAAIVVKILNGARPADIPVEQPTEFHLALKRQRRRSASPCRRCCWRGPTRSSNETPGPLTPIGRVRGGWVVRLTCRAARNIDRRLPGLWLA